MTTDGPDERGDQEPSRTYRPALVRLTLDVREIREELLAGFPSRTDVLKWEQRLTVRSLGEVPTSFYRELARQYRFSELPVEDAAERKPRQGALLAALLQETARERDLDADVVDEVRERVYATYIAPAYHRAFRQLRKSAGEYIEKTDEESGHYPERQKHIAMRPALDEIDSYQSRALGDVLDGLEDRGAILDWIEDVELATHGEVRDAFTGRCYKEPSTVAVLTSSGPETRAAREIFAAHHLLPAFNDGVRDLVGRSGELPDVEHERSKPTMV